MLKLKNGFNRFIDNTYISWTVISLAVYLVVEAVNQRGPVGLFRFIFTSPWAFVLNLAMVMLTYSAVLFIRKRVFNYTLVTLLWIIVTGINLVLLLQRNTQFNASDVVIFRYGIFITTRYLSVLHCILIAIGLTIATLFIIFLYRNGHKSNTVPQRKTAAIWVSSLVCAVVVMVVIGNISGILTPRFIQISEGYSRNGFIYAFGCSIFETGVDEPENFSDDSVEGIVSKLEEEDYKSDSRPNVIFVQLETFIDPDLIKGLEFNEDPVPNFNKMKEEFPSGYLTVPVVGGGTANCEFEVLTGMNLNYFGTIEYPYESFADRTTCESMAYNYKALGYKAHVMHNFSAGFYMRDKVFANLGFDTFTPFEYMDIKEYNPTGWAKDKILKRYILSALESTEERDFVYAISVQGHGSYPTDFDDSESDVETTYHTEDIESIKAQLGYYITQVKEMDSFVGELEAALRDYEEPTVMVLFGDHLPGVPLTADMMETESLYDTEYVIWSNFGLEGEDCDLYTYQLAAHVQQLLGFSSGTITKFHQTYKDSPEYQEYMQILEYDITEGDMQTYNGTNPFVSADMTFGVEEVAITDVNLVDGVLYVKGKNFNEHSAIYINGKHKSTEYLSDGNLISEGVKISDGDSITIAQMSYQMPWTYLGQCEEYIYGEKDEDTDN